MSNIIDFNLKRGKFYFGTFENYYEVDAQLYIFATTHSNTIPDGTLLVEQLAPSLDLLIQKKAWLDKGIFEEKFDKFREMYLEEIYNRSDYQKAMNRIMELAREGKKIVLFDNCNLGELCHLNILKEELNKKGYKVEDIKKKATTDDPLSQIRW